MLVVSCVTVKNHLIEEVSEQQRTPVCVLKALPEKFKGSFCLRQCGPFHVGLRVILRGKVLPPFIVPVIDEDLRFVRFGLIGSEDHDEMDVGSIVKATAGILQSI